MCFVYTDEERRARVELFRGIITKLEMVRFDMYREYADLQSRLLGEPMLSLEEHPVCKITTHNVGGKEILQFSYPGMMPLYREGKDRESTQYRQRVKNYYINATMEAVRRNQIKQQFVPAHIRIVHCFKDLKIRDLDNRNRSHIINGLRHSQVINDDNWQELSYSEEAVQADENSVEVVVGYAKDIHDILEIEVKNMVKTDMNLI